MINEVWSRILKYEGQEFTQIRGKIFTYTFIGNGIIPSTTNRRLSRSEFEKALEFVPLEGPSQIQHLQGPSYLFAILMDHRIRMSDW